MQLLGFLFRTENLVRNSEFEKALKVSRDLSEI